MGAEEGVGDGGDGREDGGGGGGGAPPDEEEARRAAFREALLRGDVAVLEDDGDYG